MLPSQLNESCIVVSVAFFLCLCLEKPGFLNDNGRYRYVSDNIVAHPGFGASLLLSIFVSLTVLCFCETESFVNRNVVLVLRFLVIAGGVGVIGFQDVEGFSHKFCTGLMIVSVIVLHLIHKKGQRFLKSIWFLLTSIIIASCTLLVCVWHKHKDAAVVAEVIIFVCTVGLNSFTASRMQDTP